MPRSCDPGERQGSPPSPRCKSGLLAAASLASLRSCSTACWLPCPSANRLCPRDRRPPETFSHQVVVETPGRRGAVADEVAYSLVVPPTIEHGPRACLKNVWLPRARPRPSSFVLGFAGHFEDEDEGRGRGRDANRFLRHVLSRRAADARERMPRRLLKLSRPSSARNQPPCATLVRAASWKE
jgi:hypothetical protein